jgi:signal-transduction protein with cAMP-binding, CBS, and nucleotidyltransferase domain
MYIIEVCSGICKDVVIEAVRPSDFATLTKKRYSFNWQSLKRISTIYKLTIKGEKNILGVMALIDISQFNRKPG